MKRVISFLITMSLSPTAVAIGHHSTGGFYDYVFLEAIGGLIETRICTAPKSQHLQNFRRMFRSYREAVNARKPSNIEVVVDASDHATLRAKDTGQTCTIYLNNRLCVSAARCSR